MDQPPRPRPATRRNAGALPRSKAGLASIVPLLVAGLIAGTAETQNAVANGDTRTLSIIHEHTKESATITFKRDGRYDRAALDQLNWLLRDWRESESIKMDPRLFDTVWEAQRSLGASAPLRVVCGYRSPKTNGMLRARSRGVADQSQHMLGKAMDFFMTDAGIDDIRAVGMRMQRGGVGWYPRSGSPFVHLDVGSVRAWPRMSRDQLARIFPDGKTVHLPADGKPMARYAEARAEILARGGSVLGQTAIASADAEEEGGGIRGFFASLFGDSGSAPAASVQAAPAKARGRAPIAIASADPDDATGAKQALAYAAPNSSGALRDAMLRRDGREIPSPQDLLTAEAATSAAAPAPATIPLVRPVPPRRPVEFAMVAAAISAPLPPARPIQLAALGNAGLPGMAYAASPQPFAVPDKVQPSTASVRTAPAAERGAPDTSRHQLRALFQTIAQGASQPASPSAPVRVAPAQARPAPETGSPSGLFTGTASLPPARFSDYSPGDQLSAARFSGSAVAALRTLR